MSKLRILYDGDFKGKWIKAWKEGRGRSAEYVVQVWLSGKPEGEPDGDWGFPALGGVSDWLEQAVMNTEK